MRCPHCSGAIPDGSHFCGICGGHVVVAESRQHRSAAPPSDGGSLFDLPSHGQARRGRIALVLVLDIILAGAGVAMIWSYLSSRSEAAAQLEERGAEKATPPRADDVAKTAPGPATINKKTDGKSSVPANGAAGSVGKKARGADKAKSDKTPPKPDRPKPDKPKPDKPKPDKPKPDKPKPSDGSGDGSGSSAGSGSGSGSGDAGGSGEPSEDEVGRFASRIAGTVSRNQGALRRCYAQAAKTQSPDDPLEGRVDIRFRIMPNEGVERVRAVNNTTRSTVLASCLVSHVKSWRFPGGPSTELDFVWPFRFRPSN